jgi:hypothetical protein
MKMFTAQTLTALTYLYSQGQLEADEEGIFGAQVGDEWVSEKLIEELVSSNVHVLNVVQEGDTALVQVLAWVGPEWVQGTLTVLRDSKCNKFTVTEKSLSAPLQRALQVERDMGLEPEETQFLFDEMTAAVNAVL